MLLLKVLTPTKAIPLLVGVNIYQWRYHFGMCQHDQAMNLFSSCVMDSSPLLSPPHPPPPPEGVPKKSLIKWQREILKKEGLFMVRLTMRGGVSSHVPDQSK